MANDKKTIVKEALTDYKEIMDAADANAKKKLAEEFPDKFSNLLKEEINKNKSDKKSYKKLDKSEENKEKSDMKNQPKETAKAVAKEKTREGKPFDEKTKGLESVKEDAGKGQPFDEKAKGLEAVKEDIAVEGQEEVSEEREKEFTGNVENDTPNIGKGEAEKGNAFTEKTNASSGKPMANLTEEFDLTELDIEGIGTAIENADENDELLTIDEIESEIADMEKLGEELELNQKQGDDSDPFDQLVNMRNQIDEMINSIGEQKRMGGKQSIPGRENGGPTGEMIDEKDVYEQKTKAGEQNFSARNAMGNDKGHAGMTTDLIDEHHLDNKEDKIAFIASSLEGMDDNAVDKIYSDIEGELGISEMHKGNFSDANIAKMHGGDYDEKLIDEENPITTADVEAVLGGKPDQDVDETIAMPHPNKRPTTATHPSKEFQTQGNVSRMRYAVRESEEKKINGLIGVNKKLTKKLNEVKKYKESMSGLVEGYKTALEKYRNQLKEMAVFNTNLAHVNNLLVNEELALTQDDKIKIINEFKKVGSITESQKKYKSVLSEMKENRKTLTESVEDRASASIQPSSKQKLDEVIVEKTAYENDAHINKMKRIIETIEKRGKKNNL